MLIPGKLYKTKAIIYVNFFNGNEIYGTFTTFKLHDIVLFLKIIKSYNKPYNMFLLNEKYYIDNDIVFHKPKDFYEELK